MEIFAFNENAVGYEDQGPEAQLRSFDEINLEIPKSAIMGVAGVAAATAVVSATPDAHAVVGPGDVCPPVGDVQSALNSRGFNAGVVDSNFGLQTVNAVRSFQAFNGLSVDGVVGPATADALGLGDVENPDSPFLIGNGCGNSGGAQEVSATVTASSGLIVRTGPGTFNPSVGSIPFGTTVFYDPSSRTSASGFNWVRVTSGVNAGRWVAEDFLGTEGQSGSGQDSAVVGASALNARSGPGLRFGVTGTFSNGQTVFYDTATVSSDGYSWVEVTSGSLAGSWVALDFLGGGGAQDPVVTASSLRVRTGPGLSSAIVGSFGNGAVVNFDPSSSTSRDGYEWVRVTSGIYAGRWVARDFLSI